MGFKFRIRQTGDGGPPADPNDPNYTAELVKGLTVRRVLDWLIPPVSKGVQVRQGPWEHVTRQRPGHAVSNSYVGSFFDTVRRGIRAVQSTQQTPATVETATGTEVTRLAVTLAHVSGGTSATQTDVQGDGWSNITNATGVRNGTVALLQTGLLSDTAGRIVMPFQSLARHSALTVTGLRLRAHLQAAGTVLGNGDLRLTYRLSGGAWQTLQTWNTNVDTLTAGIAYDLDALGIGPADIGNLEVGVYANAALIALGQSYRCDAVVVELDAERVDAL